MDGLTQCSMQVHAARRQPLSRAAHAHVQHWQIKLQASTASLGQEVEATQAVLSGAWPSALKLPELSSVLETWQGICNGAILETFKAMLLYSSFA